MSFNNSDHVGSQILNSVFSVVAIGVLLVSSGCASFVSSEPTMPVDAQVANAPMYQIQLAPTWGKTTVSKEVITEGMTVQDALEKAGASSKFRGMEISLKRILKKDRTVLSMPIDYNFDTKSISSNQNYALHPGDSISVGPESDGTVQKMISQLTGGAL